MLRSTKLYLLFFCLTCLSVYGQKPGDFGLLLSSNESTRWNLEYRQALGEQYRLKMGVTHGEYPIYTGLPNIIFASDSVVIQKERQVYGSQWGLRIGGERQLMQSMFSLGADLNFNYRNRVITETNSAQKIDDNGNWLAARIVDSTAQNWSSNSQVPIVFWDQGFAQVKQHFFVPALRITFNIDVPIGDAFFINFSLATSYAVPIYMGRSQVYNSVTLYQGSPPNSFEFQTTGGIGLRYILGTMKEKAKVSVEE